MNATVAAVVTAITILALPRGADVRIGAPYSPDATSAAPPVQGEIAGAPDGARRPTSRPFEVEVHGSGPPVILIPGLMSSGAVWDSAVEQWRDSYELHVLTLAGFAGVPSASNSGDFLVRAREGVIAYIRETGLDRPAIVGHSLGGFLALWIASAEPSLTRGVVAVDGVPYLVALGDTSATPQGSAGSAAAIRQMYATLTPEQMALQARMSLSMMISDSSQVATAVEWARESDPAAVGSAMAGMMVTDIRPEVHTITAPVLLLAAGGGASSADQLAQLHAVYSMQLRDVPDATTVVAEHARHFIMLDDPDFFHATVNPFLAGALGVYGAADHE